MTMKRWAGLLIVVLAAALVAGCANQDSTVKTKQGAVAGGALGAIAGGIIGNQSGRGLEGAAIGAAAGAAAGGLMGSAADEKASQEAVGQPVTAAQYVICPKCATKNDVSGMASGDTAVCGKCGTAFTVP
jgi:uncharacterized protein YcfJ